MMLSRFVFWDWGLLYTVISQEPRNNVDLEGDITSVCGSEKFYMYIHIEQFHSFLCHGLAMMYHY